MKAIYNINYKISGGASASSTARSKSELAHFIGYLCDRSDEGIATLTVTRVKVPSKRRRKP